MPMAQASLSTGARSHLLPPTVSMSTIHKLDKTRSPILQGECYWRNRRPGHSGLFGFLRKNRGCLQVPGGTTGTPVNECHQGTRTIRMPIYFRRQQVGILPIPHPGVQDYGPEIGSFRNYKWQGTY